MKEKVLENKKGITLIALVITIIVMLILVAVTITIAVNGGLFGYAGNAVKDTELAKQKELDWSNIEGGKDYDYLIDKYTKDSSKDLPAYSTSLLNAKGVLDNDAAYKDPNEVTVTIPRGFKLLLDVEDEVSKGIVIQDENGNEFVWVPVVEGTFTRTWWEDNQPVSSNELADYTEDTTTAEYQAMAASVATNGGFYIGRYEAGSTTDRTSESVNTEMVVKAGVTPYYFVTWEDDSDVEKKGAVTLSREMYTGKTGYNVKSTLCYGVQWDAVMRFVSGEKSVTDSSTWGNYGGELKNTGSVSTYQARNIYDLAGNVREWTMEAYSASFRVLRGGRYNGLGSDGPASHRFSLDDPAGSSSNLGFRVTLYL